MAAKYTVQLEFDRPPEDIRRMSEVLRRSAEQREGQDKEDIVYSADVMGEIADKMEK